MIRTSLDWYDEADNVQTILEDKWSAVQCNMLFSLCRTSVTFWGTTGARERNLFSAKVREEKEQRRNQMYLLLNNLHAFFRVPCVGNMLLSNIYSILHNVHYWSRQRKKNYLAWLQGTILQSSSYSEKYRVSDKTFRRLTVSLICLLLLLLVCLSQKERRGSSVIVINEDTQIICEIYQMLHSIAMSLFAIYFAKISG